MSSISQGVIEPVQKIFQSNPHIHSLQSDGTHLGIDSRPPELVLHHHDDNAEHSHHKGVVTDAFSLFEQGLPTPQPVANVRFVLGGQVQVAAGAERVTPTNVATWESGDRFILFNYIIQVQR